MPKYIVGGFQGGHPDRYVWAELKASSPRVAYVQAAAITVRTWNRDDGSRVRLSGHNVELTSVTDHATGQQYY